MIRFIARLYVNVPPGVAFDQLADMAALDQWNPNVTSSRRVQGERLRVGSRYESTIVRGRIRMTAMSTLVAIEPGRRVRYEGPISLWWSADELKFEPAKDGCCVTFRNETRAPLWLRPASPLLSAAFQPQARKAVLGAQRYLSASG